MSETLGQVWLRDHWFGSCFAAATVFVLASAVFMPNLNRVRNAADYQKVKSAPTSTTMSNSTVRSMPMKAQLTTTQGMHFSTSAEISEPSTVPSLDRKIARTGSMDLVVTHPAEGMEKIRSYAETVGGWVEQSEATGAGDAASASLTVQVPSARMEELKAELRKLAIKVENEKTNAQDLTRLYVDVQAQLRNLRAEEVQYLEIMHSAHKVSDMLEVTRKLSDVRGEIETTQAEFETLSKQVEMVSIAVSMRPQPTVQGFALNWKPMQQVKISLHDALDGLADYATAMTAVLLYLPVLLLWAGTILLGAFVLWKGVRWTGSTFFKAPPTAEKAIG
jgi:uncharacterized protein DUF4349